MSQPFMGEIRMFAGNFAPRSWAFCDGQLMSVKQNDALFSLLGTIYGGDGRTTFGLPELRGRIPVGEGDGPGLTPRKIGARSGTERETVTENQIPQHTHGLQAGTDPASSPVPTGLVTGNAGTYAMYETYRQPQDIVPLHPNCIGTTGGSQSHSNMMPYLCVNFIIATAGIYPSRN